MSETYQWVDRYPDPDEAVSWQERVDGWPAVQVYKAHAQALLGGARLVLDVGCGPGLDLVAPRAIGLDRSSTMLRKASVRSACPVVAGDAVALPFRSGCFEGVRADRVVQHTDDPTAVVAEMVRVLAPGGRLVIADPDQGTLVLEVPGASPALVELVADRRRHVQYRQGLHARRLPALLDRLGLDDVTVDAFALVLTSPDEAFGLPTWVAHALSAHAPGFEEHHQAEWDAAMGQAREQPGFVYAVTYFVVSGQRPR